MRIAPRGLLLITIVALGALPASAQKRQRDLITREEIVAVDGAQTAYDVVRRIHPEWLRVSGVRSMGGGGGGVQVYLNERKEGSATALRNIDIGAIGEIRYLDGPEAEARFGQNHAAGAIMVNLFSGTRKDSPPPVKPPEKPQLL